MNARQAPFGGISHKEGVAFSCIHRRSSIIVEQLYSLSQKSIFYCTRVGGIRQIHHEFPVRLSA